MTLSQESGPSTGPRPEVHPSILSLAELGQTLRLARQIARLSIPEAAARTGLGVDEVGALESGEPERITDRIGTLRNLRLYAEFLGLSGDEIVLAAVHLWPGSRSGLHDITGSHILSMSHSPAALDGGGEDAPSRTITTGHVTGVVDSPLALAGSGDTGLISAYDMERVVFDETGQVPAVGRPPVALRRAVFTLAFLVALGGIALGALAVQSHVSGWYHHVRSALGITSPKPSKPSNAHDAVVSAPLPKVTDIEGPDTVTINVGAPSFTVKFAAFKYPCWIKVTEAGRTAPVYDSVLAGGSIKEFTIASPTSIEMASSSGRVYLYEKNRFIGWYFPGKAPFTLNFVSGQA